MIDPDIIQVKKDNLSDRIDIKQVPEFDFIIYNLEDEKEYDKFITAIEREVRKSFEYRQFVSYLRENMDMNKCAFLKGVSNQENAAIKIELHHYPFSLRDIVDIVIKKRQYYNEVLELQMIAKEVMILHYNFIIGLIPLSVTVHKVYHKGKLFIPIDSIVGRYNLFIDYYKPFITPQMLESIERIEKYTREKTNDILDTTILEQNKVYYNIEDKEFTLPEFDNIQENMNKQLEAIKNNNYLLPDINTDIYDKKKDIIKPIYFVTK